MLRLNHLVALSTITANPEIDSRGLHCVKVTPTHAVSTNGNILAEIHGDFSAFTKSEILIPGQDILSLKKIVHRKWHDSLVQYKDGMLACYEQAIKFQPHDVYPDTSKLWGVFLNDPLEKGQQQIMDFSLLNKIQELSKLAGLGQDLLIQRQKKAWLISLAYPAAGYQFAAIVMLRNVDERNLQPFHIPFHIPSY